MFLFYIWVTSLPLWEKLPSEIYIKNLCPNHAARIVKLWIFLTLLLKQKKKKIVFLFWKHQNSAFMPSYGVRSAAGASSFHLTESNWQMCEQESRRGGTCHTRQRCRRVTCHATDSAMLSGCRRTDQDAPGMRRGEHVRDEEGATGPFGWCSSEVSASYSHFWKHTV